MLLHDKHSRLYCGLPLLCLLDLQVLAETAAAATSAAEGASRAAAAAETDNAAELYRKAQQMLAASTRLQQATQRAADSTDTIEATAALLCTSAAEASANAQTESGVTEEGTSGRADAGSPSIMDAESRDALLYNVEALQLWLLSCCQASKGGMRDKPGKPPDYYHTCYCLSGLSSSQNYGGFVLGPANNKLLKADPLCNVVEHRLAEALEHAQTNV